MECPACSSKVISLLSCGCEDVNCKDLLICADCGEVFNIGN
jgi:hypothetical protein